MFTIALLIGFYSYLVFFLGINSLLTKNLVLVSSIIYFCASFIYLFKTRSLKIETPKNYDKFSIFTLLLLMLAAIINLIGVLGPEISFDALWYHLTLPKLYILNESIFHIPGNLLYYSDIPKLTEMLYTPALLLGNVTLAKLIHFSFGILTLLTIYKVSRKFFSHNLSLLAGLIFYSSLVVGWESITAYADLSRTFFEVMSFWAFINWYENKNLKELILSGIFIGFAISSKLLSIGSLLVFVGVLFYLSKQSISKLIKNALFFLVPAFLIPMPWFIFSFVNTGNPIYPFFDNRVSLAIQGTGNLIVNFFKLFLFSSDPVSPIFLIVLPILIFLFSKVSNKIRLLYVYSLLAVIFLLLTPNIGGGRFTLAYLPVFSILTIYAFKIQESKIKIILIITAVLISVSSIGYRFVANAKFIPVVIGKETKSEFLTKNLNFSFGDFYDTDNYFSNRIKKTDKVLLYGFHNLFYVNFPFIHSSWVKKGDKFNYIATQDTNPPERFKDWKLIYYNELTKVKLYNYKGQIWVY